MLSSGNISVVPKAPQAASEAWTYQYKYNSFVGQESRDSDHLLLPAWMKKEAEDDQDYECVENDDEDKG